MAPPIHAGAPMSSPLPVGAPNSSSRNDGKVIGVIVFLVILFVFVLPGIFLMILPFFIVDKLQDTVSNTDAAVERVKARELTLEEVESVRIIWDKASGSGRMLGLSIDSNDCARLIGIAERIGFDEVDADVFSQIYCSGTKMYVVAIEDYNEDKNLYLRNEDSSAYMNFEFNSSLTRLEDVLPDGSEVSYIKEICEDATEIEFIPDAIIEPRLDI